MGVLPKVRLVIAVAAVCCRKPAPPDVVDAAPVASAAPSTPVRTLAPCGIEPVALAQDATTLYLAEDKLGASGSVITAIPKGGGAARVLYEGPDLVGPIAVSGKDVFVMRRSLEGGGVCRVEGGALHAVPITAPPGPHQVLHDARTDAEVISFDAGFDEMVVDDTSIFVAGKMRGEVGKVARAGGKLEVLAREVAVTGLAADATNVYFTTSGGVVGRVPKAGGAATTLASGRTSPHDVAVADGTVAWLEGTIASSQGFVLRAGGAPEKLPLPADGKSASSLALVGPDVFFLASDEYGLDRVARASSGVATVVRGPIAPSQFVVDGRTLYFVGLRGGHETTPTGVVGSVALP